MNPAPEGYFPQVYDELRRLAAAKLAQERSGPAGSDKAGLLPFVNHQGAAFGGELGGAFLIWVTKANLERIALEFVNRKTLLAIHGSFGKDLV